MASQPKQNKMADDSKKDEGDSNTIEQGKQGKQEKRDNPHDTPQDLPDNIETPDKQDYMTTYEKDDKQDNEQPMNLIDL